MYTNLFFTSVVIGGVLILETMIILFISWYKPVTFLSINLFNIDISILTILFFQNQHFFIRCTQNVYTFEHTIIYEVHKG